MQFIDSAVNEKNQISFFEINFYDLLKSKPPDPFHPHPFIQPLFFSNKFRTLFFTFNLPEEFKQ